MPRAASVALALLLASGCHTVVASGDVAIIDMGPPPPVQKVDILFMIDNSPSVPEQIELRNRFPQLIKALDSFAAQGHPASYHFGVVSSDVGAGPYTLNNGQCHPGGDGGKLFGAPSATGNPPAACSTLAFVGGARFIDYNQLNSINNIMGGVDLPTAFNCISTVGDGGCGFEAPLESVYRALHDPIPENAGFLRADALLVVVYLTDEDDCSGPPDGDLFDPASDMYGILHSFRCTQYGIACGAPSQPLPDGASGPFNDCRPLTMAEGGKLVDIDKYIHFFADPAERGGVKANPANVVVAGIFAPPAPVGVQITAPCADQTNTASCPILNHSCISATNGHFFGDPAVRMTAVVQGAPTWNIQSLCDTDYTPTMDWLAQKIFERVK